MNLPHDHDPYSFLTPSQDLFLLSEAALLPKDRIVDPRPLLPSDPAEPPPLGP